MGRPKLKGEPKNKKLVLCIEQSFFDALKADAEAEGLPTSTYCCQILRHRRKRRKQPQATTETGAE